ncbi:Hypothetical predicted protein, partial [Olea europaea subsp. europaea]
DVRNEFMNNGKARDVNEDPLVCVEVKNDKNEDDNEQRQVTDNLLVNEPVLVEEKTTLIDVEEQNKQRM